MAFYTGTATTVNTLLTALQNACIDNGWTIADNLIYKNNCVIEATINGNGIQIIGGTGHSNGVLTGELRLADNRRIASSLAGIGQDISYPLLYNLHIFDKEVYLFVNYNVDNWSYMSFGQSPVTGISGTGNWYGGIGTGSSVFDARYVPNSATSGDLYSMLFGYRRTSGTISNQLQQINCFFHHGLDSNEWSCAGSEVGDNKNSVWVNTASQAAASWVTTSCLMGLQPNNYNGEAILLPITPCVFHKDSTTRVIVGDLRYARYTRIDNYEPNQIISIGNTKYKIYPWLKKDTANRNGQSYGNSVKDTQHSGTFGVAILYDGD